MIEGDQVDSQQSKFAWQPFWMNEFLLYYAQRRLDDTYQANKVIAAYSWNKKQAIQVIQL